MRTTVFIFLSFLVAAVSAQTGGKTNDTIYRNLSVVQADSLIQANTGNPDFVIIDVRSPGEYSTEHLLNAINIEYTNTVAFQALDHSKRYLLYCLGGSRSAIAFANMQGWNFKEVYNMLGGINAWKTAGYPTTLTAAVTEPQADKNVLSFQNPAAFPFTVSIGNSLSGSLRLIDLTGQVVYNNQSVSGFRTIDISGLRSGVYFIRFEYGNTAVTKKLLIP